jgi:hypothetical protein
MFTPFVYDLFLRRCFQYISYLQAPTSQTILQHELIGAAQFLPQNNKRYSFGPKSFQYEGSGVAVQKEMVESPVLPMSLMMPKYASATQYAANSNQNQRYIPVSFGPNLRGVIPLYIFFLNTTDD